MPKLHHFYSCNYCGFTRPSYDKVEEHELKCLNNPKIKSCDSCDNYRYPKRMTTTGYPYVDPKCRFGRIYQQNCPRWELEKEEGES